MRKSCVKTDLIRQTLFRLYRSCRSGICSTCRQRETYLCSSSGRGGGGVVYDWLLRRRRRKPCRTLCGFTRVNSLDYVPSCSSHTPRALSRSTLRPSARTPSSCRCRPVPPNAEAGATPPRLSQRLSQAPVFLPLPSSCAGTLVETLRAY